MVGTVNHPRSLSPTELSRRGKVKGSRQAFDRQAPDNVRTSFLPRGGVGQQWMYGDERLGVMGQVYGSAEMVYAQPPRGLYARESQSQKNAITFDRE